MRPVRFTPRRHTNAPAARSASPEGVTPAAHAAAQAELALKASGALGVWTDAESYAGRWVLVAVARPIGVCVLQIPADEYDGIELTWMLLGLDLMAKPAPNIEQLRKQKKELRT